eukprot:Em0001g2980a
MGQAAAHQRRLDLIIQQDVMAEREHQRHLKRLEKEIELENARAVSSSATVERTQAQIEIFERLLMKVLQQQIEKIEKRETRSQDLGAGRTQNYYSTSTLTQ